MVHYAIGCFRLVPAFGSLLSYGSGTGRDQEPPGFEGEDPADPPEFEAE